MIAKTPWLTFDLVGEDFHHDGNSWFCYDVIAELFCVKPRRLDAIQVRAHRKPGKHRVQVKLRFLGNGWIRIKLDAPIYDGLRRTDKLLSRSIAFDHWCQKHFSHNTTCWVSLVHRSLARKRK